MCACVCSSCNYNLLLFVINARFISSHLCFLLSLSLLLFLGKPLFPPLLLCIRIYTKRKTPTTKNFTTYFMLITTFNNFANLLSVEWKIIQIIYISCVIWLLLFRFVWETKRRFTNVSCYCDDYDMCGSFIILGIYLERDDSLKLLKVRMKKRKLTQKCIC